MLFSTKLSKTTRIQTQMGRVVWKDPNLFVLTPLESKKKILQ